MDTKFNFFHNKHDFSILLNSALQRPELLEDDDEKSNNNSRTSGRWSKEEHHRFIEGLTKYGKNWKKVEEHIGTRTGAQIRSHAQKFFIRLTKEYKKRYERDTTLGSHEDNYHIDEKAPKNRQRSNSVISNFSNFSIDNMSENEEEEKSHIDPNPQIKDAIKPAIAVDDIKKDIEAGDSNTSKENLVLEKFLSNVSEKQEDVKNKLIKSQENNEILKIPTYEKELSHYQGVIKFFQGLHSYYESGTLSHPPHQGFLEANEIKQNQSFFDFILKNLEKYVNKANNTDNGSPARIRKLSDLVVMPEEHIKFAQSPFIERKTTSPYKNDITLSAEMPRIRKNSFKMCNENEVENNKKLENLKRKIVIKDVLEKKQKI